MGKLLTRKFRAGYTQTLGYDASGNNTTTDDSLSRHVSFTYAAGGFVDSFTDTAGTITHYYYVDRSCLSPPCGWDPPDPTEYALLALQTVTYPDSKSVMYEYEDARTQDRFALTGITDELAVSAGRVAAWNE